MWRRKKLLNWSGRSLGQTFGSAHQASRSLNWRTRRSWCSEDRWIRKRSFRDWVRGLQKARGFGQGQSETGPNPSGFEPGAWKTLRPGTAPRRGKGQPEGNAIKSNTGKPRVAWSNRKTCNAAGRNNSNLTPLAASVANGGWELL